MHVALEGDFGVARKQTSHAIVSVPLPSPESQSYPTETKSQGPRRDGLTRGAIELDMYEPSVQ